MAKTRDFGHLIPQLRIFQDMKSYLNDILYFLLTLCKNNKLLMSAFWEEEEGEEIYSTYTNLQFKSTCRLEWMMILEKC